MTSFDDLDAPQFCKFDDADQEEVETYFQIDHESIRQRTTVQKVFGQQQQSFDGDFYSILSSPSSSICSNKSGVSGSRKIRRSISSGNIPLSVKELSVAFDEVKLDEDKNKACSKSNGKHIRQNASKANNGFQYGKLMKGTSNSQSRLKTCSQNSLNRLAAPKRHHSSTGNLVSSPQSYVSVAEAVKRFQELTPKRFHTKGKNQTRPMNEPALKLKHTIPYSPKLMTKMRIKPNSNQVLSHEQRELKEFEEAQKCKVKANPFNKRIFQQPLKAVHHSESKPATVPQPFNITQVETRPRTAPSPKREQYQFHAKPVPKSVLEPKLLQHSHPKSTIPVTPSFMKKLPKPSPLKKSAEKPSVQASLTKTKPVPFSFEKRDIQMMKKKEEHLKKLKEEERKAREFHAKPIPKSIEKIIEKQKKSNVSSVSSNSDCRKSNEDIRENFKARPPTVLYQKPFEPKKLDQPLTEIQPFQLNSEFRAKERELFEKRKKEMLEKAAEILRIEEEERIKKEQEELKKLRKETAFKAQPVRNFKDFILKPSGKCTIPISPVFRSGTKSDKENVQQEKF